MMRECIARTLQNPHQPERIFMMIHALAPRATFSALALIYRGRLLKS